MPEKILVGKIAHFFPKISVAVLDVMDTVRIGDKISIEKEDGYSVQTIASMQIEHAGIAEAKKGQSVGLKVAEKPKEGAKVFKIFE